MILFRCDSVYQLMNAIQLKKTLEKDQKADLLLSNHVDFKDIPQKLKEAGVFETIYRIESNEKSKEYWKLTMEEREYYSLHPEEYVETHFLEKTYTDFYISFDTAYSKLLYYFMVSKMPSLKVHLFEDGMATYVCNVKERCKQDGMSHEHYGEKAFYNRIVELLVYEPMLFTEAFPSFPILPIPKINTENKEVCNLFRNVFGSNSLPKERYIFLEEAFLDDNNITNDMELFLKFVQLVGKENIIVKRHPRSPYDRFTPMGFSVMEATTTPFEMTLMDYDISEKIFVTVTSTASVTGKLVFQKEVHTILLYHFFEGKSWMIENRQFKKYFKGLLRLLNGEEQKILIPKSWEELQEIVIYFRGILGVKGYEASDFSYSTRL